MQENFEFKICLNSFRRKETGISEFFRKPVISVLAKKKGIEKKNLDKKCLFCNKEETVAHLFFECPDVTQLWQHLLPIMGRVMGHDYESVARLWISNSKNTVSNMLSLQ